MNRGAHLMQTLPVNIRENEGYPGIEFVVLDYNSQDNIGDWIKETLGDHVRSGILKYYKTAEPQDFHSSHAKNMALRLGTGDVICMVDADNYAGPGYASWIDSVFSAHGGNAIITTLRKDAIVYRDQGGKFGFGRELFYSVRGLDESLVGYGMEDTDLINRIENAGGKRVYIEGEHYLRYIGHSNEDRVSNFRFAKNLEKIYMRVPPAEPSVNWLLFLFRDNTFSQGKYKYYDSLKGNLVRSFFGWCLEGLRQGNYERMGNEVRLNVDGQLVASYREGQDGMLSSVDAARPSSWKEVRQGDELYLKYVFAYTECLNRIKYAGNDKNPDRVNPNGWGRGRVSRNFDENDSFDLS